MFSKLDSQKFLVIILALNLVTFGVGPKTGANLCKLGKIPWQFSDLFGSKK